MNLDMLLWWLSVMVLASWAMEDQDLDSLIEVCESDLGSSFKATLTTRKMQLRNCLVKQVKEMLKCNDGFDNEQMCLATAQSSVSRPSNRLRPPNPGSQANRVLVQHELNDIACGNGFAIECSLEARFRTISGSCNNLKNPAWGSAGSKLARFIPNEYADGVQEPRGTWKSNWNQCKTGRQGKKDAEDADEDEDENEDECKPDPKALLPNPRLLTYTLHQAKGGDTDAIFVDTERSMFLVSFGQFLDHDITLVPEMESFEDCCSEGNMDDHDTCFPIFIPCQDPHFGVSQYKPKARPKRSVGGRLVARRVKPYHSKWSKHTRHINTTVKQTLERMNRMGSDQSRLNRRIGGIFSGAGIAPGSGGAIGFTTKAEVVSDDLDPKKLPGARASILAAKKAARRREKPKPYQDLQSKDASARLNDKEKAKLEKIKAQEVKKFVQPSKVDEADKRAEIVQKQVETLIEAQEEEKSLTSKEKQERMEQVKKERQKEVEEAAKAQEALDTGNRASNRMMASGNQNRVDSGSSSESHEITNASDALIMNPEIQFDNEEVDGVMFLPPEEFKSPLTEKGKIQLHEREAHPADEVEFVNRGSRSPEWCLEFRRSVPFCQWDDDDEAEGDQVREQMNGITSFIDGSAIYGSEVVLAKTLRLMSSGLLKASERGVALPKLEKRSVAGDSRALEMPDLAALHTLFMREHNLVATTLDLSGLCCKGAKNEAEKDEILYQRARRIVIAELQNIVYGQYLLQLLGKDLMDQHDLSLNQFSQYDPDLEPSIYNGFAAAAFRFGHSTVWSPVKVMDEDNRMVREYDIKNMFFDEDLVISRSGFGADFVLNGIAETVSGLIDLSCHSDITNFLFVNGTGVTGNDLIARNIQRGRDHGVPSYNSFREFCGLPKACSWKDKPDEIVQVVWDRLADVYDKPRDIDLFVGGLAELPANGSMLGPTFACIVAKQFHALKYGDRYFFTHVGPLISMPFDPNQVENIRKRTLTDIMCDNTVMKSVSSNPFIRDSKRTPCFGHNRLDFSLFSDDYENALHNLGLATDPSESAETEGVEEESDSGESEEEEQKVAQSSDDEEEAAAKDEEDQDEETQEEKGAIYKQVSMEDLVQDLNKTSENEAMQQVIKGMASTVLTAVSEFFTNWTEASTSESTTTIAAEESESEPEVEDQDSQTKASNDSKEEEEEEGEEEEDEEATIEDDDSESTGQDEDARRRHSPYYMYS